MVLDAVPPHMKPGMGLMMLTALGPTDALNLPRTFYRNREIATRRSKTGGPVFWEAPEQLVAILTAAPPTTSLRCAPIRAGSRGP